MKTNTKSTPEVDILRNKMDQYINANKNVESEVSITTTVKVDVLRRKMDEYVIKNIERFIAPEFSTIQDAIHLAREWRKDNVSIHKINERIEVMEELTEMERMEELARLEEVLEEEMEEEARRDGMNIIKERDPRLIGRHDWDEPYTWEYEENDTY